MAKINVLRKEQKKHLKGEVGQAKRDLGTGVIRYEFLKTGLLHIHLGRCELRVLINNCQLHYKRLYCTCLSHNSICYNQMYVCIQYL